MQRLLLGVFLIIVLLLSGCKEKAQEPAPATANKTEFAIGGETTNAPTPTVPIRNGSTVFGMVDVLKTVNPAVLLQDMAERVRNTDTTGMRSGNLDIAVSVAGTEGIFSVSSTSQDGTAMFRVLAELAGTKVQADGYVNPETGILIKIPELSEEWACLFGLSGNFGITGVSFGQVCELVSIALESLSQTAAYETQTGTYAYPDDGKLTGTHETWTWGPEELSAVENEILAFAYEHGILENEPGTAEQNDTVKLCCIGGEGYTLLSLYYGDRWESREFFILYGEDAVDVWDTGKDNYLFYDEYAINVLSAKKNDDGSWTVILNPYETIYGEHGNTRTFENRKIAVKVKEDPAGDGYNFSFSGDSFFGHGLVGEGGLNATLRMQGLTAVISADMENRLGSVTCPNSDYNDFSSYLESLPDNALENWLEGLYGILGDFLE